MKDKTHRNCCFIPKVLKLNFILSIFAGLWLVDISECVFLWSLHFSLSDFRVTCVVLFIFFISTPPMESPDVAWNRQVNVSITFVPSNKECYPYQQDLNILLVFCGTWCSTGHIYSEVTLELVCLMTRKKKCELGKEKHSCNKVEGRLNSRDSDLKNSDKR